MAHPEIVVAGCPSLDRVILRGEARDVVGGAAWITALAARCAGATVGLLARVPQELPPAVARCFGRGGLHRAGLRVVAGRLPSFVAAYGEALEATWIAAEPGTEDGLCAADMPEEWLDARLVHVASLGGSSERQLRFVAGLRERGYRGPISAGTWGRAVQREPALVGELLLLSDLFFMNRAEADALIPEGPPRSHRGVVCVTAGASGVAVHGGGTVRRAAAPRAFVVDPTGAGDSFCGGFLGATIRGLDGVAAGLALAATTLSGWGSEPLADLVAAWVEPRASCDPERISLLAGALAREADAAASGFCGFPFPEQGDPLAASILAVATLHQYGFWTAGEQGWTGPMFARAGGRNWKGSDFVWQAFTRAVAADPSVLDPRRMAAEADLLERICTGDDGICPLPDLESHRALHRAYGAALTDGLPQGWPATLERLNREPRPAAALLALLAGIPGYREDPLAKKANLLALILSRRPERLLDLKDPESIGPVVDYHLMRACLRTGCVRVPDEDLRRQLAARTWVDGVQEAELRLACRDAIAALVLRSGRSVAEVDGFLFARGRSICLETEPPLCRRCSLADCCGRHAEMFQPVYRTTAY